jgi:hypothetical protein
MNLLALRWYSCFGRHGDHHQVRQKQGQTVTTVKIPPNYKSEEEKEVTNFSLNFFFIRIVGGGMGPLGTSATEWPIVPAPGDYDDGEEVGGMKIGRRNPKYSEKTCPSATLSTTNST